MLRYQNKGYTIEIPLPKEYGYGGYSVECRYLYDKSVNKYSLSMWLKRSDVDEKFKVESQEIDTQYINSTKENIRHDICLIVEEAAKSGYFDFYISRYEYTYSCFERGNELCEKERLDGVNAS